MPILQGFSADQGIRFTVPFREAITIGGNRPRFRTGSRFARTHVRAKRSLDRGRRAHSEPGRSACRTVVRAGQPEDEATRATSAHDRAPWRTLPGPEAADRQKQVLAIWGKGICKASVPGSKAGSGTRASANTSGPDFIPGFGPVKLRTQWGSAPTEENLFPLPDRFSNERTLRKNDPAV